MKFSIRDEIVEVVNKLFVYTDTRDWERLQYEVFTDEVYFDMLSLGGKKQEMSARDICSLWEEGFKGIDAINHLAGNYLVHIDDNTATVSAYATATHYKASATKGKTREYVGTYHLGLMKHGAGWRIFEFRYELKYMTGNIGLD